MTQPRPKGSELERAPSVALALHQIDDEIASLDEERGLTLRVPDHFTLTDVQRAALEDLAEKVPHENDRELFDLVFAQGIVSVLRAAGFFTRTERNGHA